MAIGERLRDYRASKATLFGACVGTFILTLIVGFSWGGWVTGGTATRMAEDSADDARAQLAATICVQRFLNAEDVQAQLASLKKTNTWERDDFIEKGDWLRFAGVKEPVPGASELCAERLFKMESAAKGETAVQ